jgi:hypothetical protein
MAKEYFKDNVKPYLFGLAISVSSGFNVGLFFGITVALYVSLVYLWTSLENLKKGECNE